MALSTEAAAIRSNNWTRGSILKSDGSSAFPTKDGGVLPADDYMLISQLCDISTPTLDDEPYVEVIKLNYISEIDGSLTKAKSHKKLHIKIDDQHLAELRAMDRFIIKREILITETPEYNSTLETADAIVSWVTKKMLRRPFPDSFVSRFNSSRSRMRKILAKGHDNIQYFMVRLHTEDELPEGDVYKVAILFIVESSITEDELEKTRNVLDRVADLMNEHDGIDVISADTESSDLVTLSEFAEYTEFYFDDLSWV